VVCKVPIRPPPQLYGFFISKQSDGCSKTVLEMCWACDYVCSKNARNWSREPDRLHTAYNAAIWNQEKKWVARTPPSSGYLVHPPRVDGTKEVSCNFSPGVSIPLYEVLETSPSHHSARHTVALASGIIWHVLTEEIARRAKDFWRNNCSDREDGERELVMGSGATTRRIVEVGNRSE
jgi:hypothetical protein